MADNSGFRVDRLGSVDVRTGAKVDHLVTILDYPWVAIWMSPRETIKKIVNRDPRHQVIMLGALAGGLAMLNFFLGAALGFTPIPPSARLVSYLPILTLVSPFLGAVFGLLGLYIGAFLMDWSGRALGGIGNAVTVRAAVAWSQVPQICLAVDAADPSGHRSLAGVRPLAARPECGLRGRGRRGEAFHARTWGRVDHLDLVVHPDAALRGRGASFFGLACAGRFPAAGSDLYRDRGRGQNRHDVRMTSPPGHFEIPI